MKKGPTKDSKLSSSVSPNWKITLDSLCQPLSSLLLHQANVDHTRRLSKCAAAPQRSDKKTGVKVQSTKHKLTATAEEKEKAWEGATEAAAKTERRWNKCFKNNSTRKTEADQNAMTLEEDWALEMLT